MEPKRQTDSQVSSSKEAGGFNAVDGTKETGGFNAVDGTKEAGGFNAVDGTKEAGGFNAVDGTKEAGGFTGVQLERGSAEAWCAACIAPERRTLRRGWGPWRARQEPRTINNCQMSGAALATMLHCFVDAINNGAVPTISTAWQNVVEMECRRATEVAETAYRNAFDTSKLPPDEAALSAAHAKAMKLAQGVFEDTAVGDGEGRRKHERRFLEKVNEHFGDLRERKMAEAE
ncbi:hypothetical protein CYMTET_46246, partial [Cymbomonas tetramitiformis]